MKERKRLMKAQYQQMEVLVYDDRNERKKVKIGVNRKERERSPTAL